MLGVTEINIGSDVGRYTPNNCLGDPGLKLLVEKPFSVVER
jgi:hypothetical protein